MITFFIACFAIYAQEPEMALVTGGSYSPLYGTKNELVKIKPFKVDIRPVTIKEFELFVAENPAWRKSNRKPLFADKMYLNTWTSDFFVADTSRYNSPVTEVSWFAAKSFCEWKKKRLLTVDEWEFIAMANETQIDAREDSLYNAYILSWYERPSTYKNRVGQTMRNVWGIYDLHGLVWEWVFDFNSVIITGESRGDSAVNRNLFCAAGAVGAKDLMNYAAFMRYAFRGSIKANYSMINLGFRYAESVEGE